MINSSEFKLSEKTNLYYKAEDILKDGSYKLKEEEKTLLEKTDIVYRALCAILYNFAPLSGHPGGSISSGRIAASGSRMALRLFRAGPALLEASRPLTVLSGRL